MQWFIIAVLSAVIIVMLLQRYTRLEFVSHAKLLWKTWSVWLGTLGGTLSAIFLGIPDAAITAWAYLPEDVKAMLDPSFVKMVGPFLMFMALVSQFIKQRKLAEQKNE